MKSLELRETLISVDKIESDPETTDRILDLESGTIDGFDKPAPGMWLLPRNSEHCCIYRVPNSIRQINPEAYTPQLVIIGPLHHSLKSQALKSRGDITNTKSMDYLNMEQYKKFYLAKFAERIQGEQTIDELRRIIEEDEEMIRASYSESTAWIESQPFVDMILHDSVFIIEFFLRTRYQTTNKIGDPLMDDTGLELTVDNDLLLLENQIPYVILEKLFSPIVPKLIPNLIPTILPNQTFRELVIAHFDFEEGKIKDSSRFQHFTDLIRQVHVETLPKVYLREHDKRLEHMYSADKLNSGGVKFEAIKDDFSLNVRFENGCLKLHCLEFVDNVEMRLRNIMALEQCHYIRNAYVCNYVNFLDYLIDTHKDVELLVEKGIIKNCIGQDSFVAEMVNKLCLGICASGSNYYDIANEVNTYYTNPINRLRAILKRVYFGNMWTGTSTLAATFLLVMTLIQTVTSIIQTKK